MSLQWTFIAGYLYFEIAVVIILILPILSPRRWHQFFKSRLFAIFQQHAAWYFYVFLGVLSLFLLDAIREMRKYSHSNESSVHLSTEMKGHIKLFRAQRNFYITSFAIFLAFVIKRLVTMLIIQSELELKAEKIIKQAEDTVKQAKITVLENRLNREGETEDYNELINVLEETEKLLEEEKIRVKECQEEATKWRLKYEELTSPSSGKGDE
ncbi:unnamed protein product [Parnassius mnemosyne]|uniref:Endoplasmic reticulum transmembrane protein n=1 Tax=Parnassius mnemosyne TaxID=213953 RepID=A0AAV1KCI4_9NEOP